jgi:tRNA-specific 2-thiouridylase
MTKKTKVAVGMSGGVDSTMAAYILLSRGFEVSGITMRIWQGEESKQMSGRSGCYGPGEVYDTRLAEQICSRLGIPHHVIDLTQEYKANVLDNFSREYLDGRTPNPCVLCNPLVKFGALLEKTTELGIDFDFFATGHYARIEYDNSTGRYFLKKAIDLKKDQSYYLNRLNQSQLGRSLFTVGLFKKEEIKDLASKTGFAEIADKPESQDFIDDGIYGSLFSDSEQREGDIVDLDGRLLGRHKGIIHYTIGQRKGISIGGSKEPLYVLRIDTKKNQIVVGQKDRLAVDRLTAIFMNWIAFDQLTGKLEVSARLRSHQKEISCSIFPKDDGSVDVIFSTPQYSATPGQSIVFYQNDLVLGGGIIQSTHLLNQQGL